MLYAHFNGNFESIKVSTEMLNQSRLYTRFTLPAISSYFDTEPKQRFLTHLVAKHFLIVRKNVIIANQNECQRVGTLGLIFPLFNHVCAPNLLNSSTGDQQMCITLRPVRKSDQLFCAIFMYRCFNERTATLYND